jgi:hypothetical protein
MKKSRLLGAVCVCFAVASFTANAVVVNTLNGMNYEWLELTVTEGMSRDSVQAQIAAAAPGDTLYGYEYASRSLVESLLLSYSSWDGINGWHSAPEVAGGVANFLTDFGALIGHAHDNQLLDTAEGYAVSQDYHHYSYAFYGTAGECLANVSCLLEVDTIEFQGSVTAAYQHSNLGWSPAATNAVTAYMYTSSRGYGSLLVRTSNVPIPASVWLFGSGLLGLAGMARRKA